MTLVLVKLGGSLITNKNKKESLREKTLKRLCKEIHLARKKKKFDLIIGHGGGSYPHFPAYKYKIIKGIKSKRSLKGFALTHDAAARLNRIVVRELINAGENAVSIQPSALLIAKNNRIHTLFIEPFKHFLENGFVPVPYGDAALDLEKGITIISTEQILRELALKLNAKRLIVVGKTRGVFTDDPLKNKKAEFIPVIDKYNYPKIKGVLKGSHGIDVTGGMLHKVRELIVLARKGIECQIISGEEKGALKKSLLGKRIGTIIR